MLGQRNTTPMVTVVCPVTILHHMASLQSASSCRCTSYAGIVFYSLCCADLVTNPSCPLPGFTLPRRQFVTLNRLRCGHTRCAESVARVHRSAIGMN